MKNGATISRPSKFSPAITKLIGDNVALGLPYALAAEAAGITYQTFNDWHKKGRIQNLENTLSSINLFKNATRMRQRNVLNVLMNLQKQEIARFVCGF